MVFFGDLGLYSLIGSYIIFLRVSWGLGCVGSFQGPEGFTGLFKLQGYRACRFYRVQALG